MRVILAIPTDEEMATLPHYDHTKLSAVNTCPVWGIIRYEHHKTLQGSHRAMALEAGGSSHDSFAAIRLFQLGFHQSRLDLMHYHGERQFGVERWQRIFAVISPTRSPLNNATNVAIEAFTSSGFYDDDNDKRRTTDNIIEAIMEYVRQWDFERYPVWIRDQTPTSDVGVEIAFSYKVVLSKNNNDLSDLRNVDLGDKEFIFTGKMDGIHVNPKDNSLIIHENKTGARLDDAWLAQWRMSHQITGYAVAAAEFTGAPVPNCQVIGMQIPLPRSTRDGIRTDRVPRDPNKIAQWANWLWHTVDIVDTHRDNPLDAPRYTHSCNRYFRTCSFISLCDMEPVEQKLIYDEMIIEEWSPLHDTSKVVG